MNLTEKLKNLRELITSKKTGSPTEPKNNAFLNVHSPSGIDDEKSKQFNRIYKKKYKVTVTFAPESDKKAREHTHTLKAKDAQHAIQLANDYYKRHSVKFISAGHTTAQEVPST